jgi:hypothetical protein
MIQFHSTPLSEPVAQLVGLIVGLGSYAISGAIITLDCGSG